MRKNWIATALVLGLSFFASPARAIETDGLEPIGAYQSHQATDRGVEIRCQDGSVVRIAWLAPDLARVRVGYRHGLDPVDASWAIAKKDWAPVSVAQQDSPEKLVMTSSELRLVVHKNPLRVEFQDLQGHVLNRDQKPIMGDPKGVYKDKLFDPEAGSMLVVTKALGLEEHFYGLGEKAHPLDRRRGHFSMWNSDTPHYEVGRDPIYQSIPFYVGLENGRAYGLFFDNSHRSHFDFGESQQEFVGYAVEGGEIDYYFFGGPSMTDVVSRYTELTGRIYLPPRWAMGHQASRWSYYPASLVEEVARTYQEHDLPLDVMTLDIDYMQKYRVFTWDRQNFPDPAGLARRLKDRGLHVVTIVDPGVKYQPSEAPEEAGDQPELKDQSKSYYVFNQGLKNGFFVKRKSGQPMVTKVWPGETVFVDYTQEAARKWWGDLHRAYLDQGVGGIWNDMNEPADFLDQTGGNQRDSVFEDLGRHSGHAKNRNLIALLMCRSTYEGLLRLRPNARPYVITRAAYAGIQRYSTMWTGDAPSTWENLGIVVPMFCNLGLSGETFIGSDVGGFNYRGNGELLTRAYQISFLAPFCRNHKDRSGYDQEPWRFGPFYESIIRKYLKLRYRLLPYMYAGIEEAHRSGIPFLRPLVLHYQDDPETWSLDDEFLAGRDLLAAPITHPREDDRRVYFPRGRWYDFYSGQPQNGGQTVEVDAPIETIPLFARAGSVIPLGPEKNTVEALPQGPLELRFYLDPAGNARTQLYEDDGNTQGYLNGQWARRSVSCQRRADRYEVQISPVKGSYALPQRPLHLRFYGAGNLRQARMGDLALALRKGNAYWEVVLPDQAQGVQLQLR